MSKIKLGSNYYDLVTSNEFEQDNIKMCSITVNNITSLDNMLTDFSKSSNLDSISIGTLSDDGTFTVTQTLSGYYALIDDFNTSHEKGGYEVQLTIRARNNSEMLLQLNEVTQKLSDTTTQLSQTTLKLSDTADQLKASNNTLQEKTVALDKADQQMQAYIDYISLMADISIS